MSKLTYSHEYLAITFTDDDGVDTTFDCHDEIEDGYNSIGQARESLPAGTYTCWAEDRETALNNGPSYGTFYIHTGDPRSRDIHGGGSSLDDPYAPYQGWLCTYGCLRMQNAEGEQLSALIAAAGNHVELTVS